MGIRRTHFRLKPPGPHGGPRLEVDEAVTRGSEDRDTISGVELDVAVELDKAAPLRVTDAQ